ncbi:MAG: fasciclin domain-containing protein, partial [Pseudomonadota bacterium]
MEPETIADLAAGNEDLEILTAALEATGLDAAVADPDADLTVFAPTDAAFGALAVDLGFTGDVADEDAVFAFLATLGTETLSTVLLYHVLGASEDLASLSGGDARETLQGGSVVVGGGFVFDADADDLASAAVIEGLSDVAASNGIVQVVDRVLRPVDLPQAEEPAFESIAAAAVALSTTEGFDDDTGDFDVLLAALEATGLTAAVADTSATLTVAAPTDQAVIDLAVALGATPADEAEAFAAIASAL